MIDSVVQVFHILFAILSSLFYWLFLLFGHSVMSNSLRPHGQQHARLPSPSPSPGACSNSCPLSQWCHPTISSSVIPFPSCLQSFPASGSFLMSQLFTSGGQSIGASASASVLPMNIQDWFPLGLTGLISLQCKGFSRVFFNTTAEKHPFFGAQLSLWSNSHIHTTGKTIDLIIQTFGKVMSLLFNMLSRFVIAFLLRSKCFLIWASAFQFHGYSHSLQWFWSPRKENLSLLPLFSFLFAMKWWDKLP